MDPQAAAASASNPTDQDAALPSTSSDGPIPAAALATMPSVGPADEDQEEEEAWLVGEVRALAARLAHGAVLRPRAAALLAEAEAQVEG